MDHQYYFVTFYLLLLSIKELKNKIGNYHVKLNLKTKVVVVEPVFPPNVKFVFDLSSSNNFNSLRKIFLSNLKIINLK